MTTSTPTGKTYVTIVPSKSPAKGQERAHRPLSILEKNEESGEWTRKYFEKKSLSGSLQKVTLEKGGKVVVHLTDGEMGYKLRLEGENFKTKRPKPSTIKLVLSLMTLEDRKDVKILTSVEPFSIDGVEGKYTLFHVPDGESDRYLEIDRYPDWDTVLGWAKEAAFPLFDNRTGSYADRAYKQANPSPKLEGRASNYDAIPF